MKSCRQLDVGGAVVGRVALANIGVDDEQRRGALAGPCVIHHHRFVLRIVRRRQYPHSLSKGARCNDNLINGHSGNHSDAGTGDAPAENVCPHRVDVVIGLQRYVLVQSVRRDHQEEDGSDEFPADPPVNTGSESRHLFDIATEAIDTVDPGNGDRFEKNGDQYGVLGREPFQ